MTLRWLTLALTGLNLMLAAALPATAVAIELACPPGETATPTATPPAMLPTEAAWPDGEVELTVFAASSLTDAYAEIADAIETTHPNVTIVVETAGSQTLVTQLSEGARADVLATANTSTMRQAQDSDLLDGSPVPFVANRLVIVTSQENPAGIEGIEDLTGDDIRLVIAAEDVPAGRYARTAICAWAGDDEAARAAIGDNVVSEEIDVRSVMAKVQLGEADAGIVYASDAASAERSGGSPHVIEFPDGVPVTATYPIAPVAGGDSDAANAFIAFVLSDEGQRILESHGFTPVS